MLLQLDRLLKIADRGSDQRLQFDMRRNEHLRHQVVYQSTRTLRVAHLRCVAQHQHPYQQIAQHRLLRVRRRLPFQRANEVFVQCSGVLCCQQAVPTGRRYIRVGTQGFPVVRFCLAKFSHAEKKIGEAEVGTIVFWLLPEHRCELL